MLIFLDVFLSVFNILLYVACVCVDIDVQSFEAGARARILHSNLSGLGHAEPPRATGSHVVRTRCPVPPPSVSKKQALIPGSSICYKPSPSPHCNDCVCVCAPTIICLTYRCSSSSNLLRHMKWEDPIQLCVSVCKVEGQ